MATRRQQNWLGQQRVDVSDLRSVESAVAADFDILAGKMMAGHRPLVVRGFTINTTSAAGNPAEQLQLSVASGMLMHFGASESGTIFMVEDDASPEVLSATNSKVRGGFIANSINYVGLDLIRSEDASTADLKQFLDADTKLEIPKTVPVARTLNYEIVISTQPFSISSNVCPIAKVETNTNNNVVAITDSRNLMFRLGSGGDSPEELNAFTWPDSTRRENNQNFNPPTSSVDPFTGGDKEISSLKDWMDAVMTRLWEVGSGEFWYRPNNRDSVKLICGQPVISATQDNFQWNSGTNTLTWQSLYLAFENSKVYYNNITNGSAVLSADGQCLYVDIQRGSSASNLVPVVGTLTGLGTPTTPGSRFILAWRVGSQIYARDRGFEVGRTYPVATTTVLGIVKLSRAATTPLSPIVLTDSERNAANGVAGLDGSQVVLGTGLSRGTTFSAGALSVGAGTNDSAVSIAKSTTTTTINGPVLVKNTIDTAAANTMSIGGATQTGLGVGRAGASTSMYGATVEIDAASDLAIGDADCATLEIGHGGADVQVNGNVLGLDAQTHVGVGTVSATQINIGHLSSATNLTGNTTSISGNTTSISSGSTLTETAATILINAGTSLTATGQTATLTSSAGATNIGTGAGVTQVNISQSGVNTSVGGNVVLAGPNPASSTGFTNTLTPKNICKAWGYISSQGSGSSTVTINQGFNISSASAPGTAITINLANSIGANGVAFAHCQIDNILVVAQVLGGGTQIQITARDMSGSSLPFPSYNFNTGSGRNISFVAFGAQ